ncbi:MAG: signal transduction histidine kinase [Acidimicrobiales bacterium]|jgi:signal transduction histidine kinase
MKAEPTESNPTRSEPTKSGPLRRVLRFLRRRWRSVSFRSGLVAAVAVGSVAAIAYVIVVSLVFVFFVVAGGLAQSTVVSRAEDQLLLGVAPDELRLPADGSSFMTGPDEGVPAFWAVLEGDVNLASDGTVEMDVVDAPFSDPGFGISFEPDSSVVDEDLGLKKVDGQEWFFVERRVEGPDGSKYRVITAVAGIYSVAGFLRSALPVALPIIFVLALVAGLLTGYLTKRALRRVEHIRTEVELITQQSLDRRVPIVDAADGIDKLARTMNVMLERLETSAAQQSQFLADASHELRSPVAGLLAQLDVATAYPDRVDTDTLLPKLRDEAQRLQLLVDDLLYLSRSEAGPSSPRQVLDVVDIDELVANEIDEQRARHPDVDIRSAPACGAQVTGQRRDLERALRNLTDNAIRHCESTVLLRSSVVSQDVCILVSDDGQGVPEDRRNDVFERFVRLDESRSRDAGGAGLGLAIAREIASRHGGHLVLESRLAQAKVDGDLGGAMFWLTLPRAAVPTPDDVLR